MYHWRSSGGAEVDLILEWNGALYPIEIKLSSSPGKKDARGISAFRAAHERERVADGLVVCPCEKPYPISESCWAMPWDWILPDL
jgi:uncharacterized protein